MVAEYNLPVETDPPAATPLLPGKLDNEHAHRNHSEFSQNNIFQNPQLAGADAAEVSPLSSGSRASAFSSDEPVIIGGRARLVLGEVRPDGERWAICSVSQPERGILEWHVGLDAARARAEQLIADKKL